MCSWVFGFVPECDPTIVPRCLVVVASEIPTFWSSGHVHAGLWAIEFVARFDDQRNGLSLPDGPADLADVCQVFRLGRLYVRSDPDLPQL